MTSKPLHHELHLPFETPSATVAGLCLTHVALDKAAYLRGLGVEADWPCQGRPGKVFVDNGSEFHSDIFKRGCGQHGIALRHRFPGAPHWGGIIRPHPASPARDADASQARR